jgi:hypothetical protein
MTRSEASDILARCHIDRGHDFHRLPSDQVEALLTEADRVKYRRPKNANGSRARYFHARVMRALNRAT